MGIDIELYRCRIGVFCGGCIRNSHRRQYSKQYSKQKYNPYSNTSDIHYRVFASCLVIFMMLVGVLGVLTMVNFLGSVVNEQALHSTISPCFNVRSDILWLEKYIGFVTITFDFCPQSESLYMVYMQRLLLLSSDVELNPGPSNDTQQILDAIKESNRKIEQVKDEVMAIRSDIAEVKNQVFEIKIKIGSIETRQNETDSKVQEVESKMDTVTYKYELLESDVESLAYNYEKKCEDFDRLEKQVYYLDRENRKKNLRIFGLPETEPETNDHLISEIEDKILNIAYPDKDYEAGTIRSARRIGAIQEDSPRMVLVEFKNLENKLKIFTVREELRKCGIKVSNDLTIWERNQLKELGKRGYFKNGELQILPDVEQDASQKSRIFKRAVRKSDASQASIGQMDTDSVAE